MPALHLSSHDELRFSEYLKHRQLNEKATALLASVRVAHDLKPTELRSAKSLAYGEIAKGLIKALNHGWLQMADLVSMLDDAELAGKQHVCVFQFPEKGKQKILDVVRAPLCASKSGSSITDYFSVPTMSTARVLSDTPKRVVVKIVTRRSYWVTNVLESSDPDREVYEKLRMLERSAVIVKCDLDDDIIQFRVPPREKGPAETSKATYDFLRETLEAHFPMNGKSWFTDIRQFQIGDAFPKIIKNKVDFALWRDTPEDTTTKAQISRKGRPQSGNDLRNDKNWHHERGYSRSSIHGFWNQAKEPLYLHMNADRVKIAKDTSRDLARLFVPKICDDEDLDHVIAWIRDHF